MWKFAGGLGLGVLTARMVIFFLCSTGVLGELAALTLPSELLRCGGDGWLAVLADGGRGGGGVRSHLGYFLY